MVRVRVRQGSGFHAMAELSILSLRVGVANLFVIAGRFITDNRELARNFPFYGAPSAFSGRFERSYLALVGRPGKTPGLSQALLSIRSVKTSEDY